MGGLFGGGEVTRTSETPLTDLNIQSSSYGNCVPLAYGRNRMSGNLIDYDDFQAIPHTSKTSSGGKGGSGGGSENTTFTYTTSFIMSLGEGPFYSINAFWVDKEFTANADVFTKALGTSAQTAWPNWTTKHPTKALAYRGLAYVAAAAYDLGSSARLGNHSFDVTALLPYEAGTIDGANPRDIIVDYLTEPNHGAGFPAASLGDWTPFSNWCIANNVFLSPVYDTQGEARQALTDLMTITNAGTYFSEGVLKITPFGDTAVTGNSVTYTPNVTPAYDLGEDDYLDPDEPIRILRTPNADAYNQVQIEYLDKTNQYNVAIATAQDQASIEVFGLKPMAVITAHQITDAGTAQLIAQLVLQRVLYTRHTYEFKIGWKYCRLEPTDYVTLTYARFGLINCPVRILSVEEDEDGTLSMQAEDAPAGVTHSPLYDSQAGSGYSVNYGVDPGNVVAPKFFETPAIKAMSGLMIGVAVNGASADWGGCEVWASYDGTSYAYMGRVDGGARYGTLSNSITAASGQVARVALAGTAGQIFTASTQDADNLASLSIIENEYVAYTTAALIAAGTYDLTLPVRAAYSTTAAIHASGASFIRVDDAIAYSNALDLPMVGKTIHFKFLSYNKWGGGKQLLADVSAYDYTVTGVMAKLPPPAIYGLAVSSAANTNIVTWTNPADATTDRVEVWRNATSDVSTAVLAGSVTGPVGIFTDNVGAGGVTYYYWVRAINKQGYPSAYLGPQSGTTGTISVTLADGSVTTVKLATGAITADKIALDAITSDKIAADAVTATELASNAVTSGKIAASAVTSGAIAASAVVAGKIAADAVTSATIAANAVIAGKINAGAVTTATIATGAITANTIGANAIIAEKIAANAVTAVAIAANAIVSGKIAADAISAANIIAGQINASHLAANTITAAKMATGTITAASGIIADAAITSAKIGDANITTLKIAGEAVTVPRGSSGVASAGTPWTDFGTSSVSISYAVIFTSSTGSTGSTGFDVTLYRSGTPLLIDRIYVNSAVAYPQTVSFNNIFLDPGQGVSHYSVGVSPAVTMGAGGGDVTRTIILAMGVKR